MTGLLQEAQNYFDKMGIALKILTKFVGTGVHEEKKQWQGNSKYYSFKPFG